MAPSAAFCCNKCGAQFPSLQALGGHKSAHSPKRKAHPGDTWRVGKKAREPTPPPPAMSTPAALPGAQETASLWRSLHGSPFDLAFMSTFDWALSGWPALAAASPLDRFNASPPIHPAKAHQDAARVAGSAQFCPEQGGMPAPAFPWSSLPAQAWQPNGIPTPPWGTPSSGSALASAVPHPPPWGSFLPCTMLPGTASLRACPREDTALLTRDAVVPSLSERAALLAARQGMGTGQVSQAGTLTGNLGGASGAHLVPWAGAAWQYLHPLDAGVLPSYSNKVPTLSGVAPCFPSCPTLPDNGSAAGLGEFTARTALMAATVTATSPTLAMKAHASPLYQPGRREPNRPAPSSPVQAWLCEGEGDKVPAPLGCSCWLHQALEEQRQEQTNVRRSRSPAKGKVSPFGDTTYPTSPDVRDKSPLVESLNIHGTSMRTASPYAPMPVPIIPLNSSASDPKQPQSEGPNTRTSAWGSWNSNAPFELPTPELDSVGMNVCPVPLPLAKELLGTLGHKGENKNELSMHISEASCKMHVTEKDKGLDLSLKLCL